MQMLTDDMTAKLVQPCMSEHSSKVPIYIHQGFAKMSATVWERLHDFKPGKTTTEDRFRELAAAVFMAIPMELCMLASLSHPVFELSGKVPEEVKAVFPDKDSIEYYRKLRVKRISRVLFDLTTLDGPLPGWRGQRRRGGKTRQPRGCAVRRRECV